MLEQECEAVARYAGDMLRQSPVQQIRPVPEIAIGLFVGQLEFLLKSMVQLTKKRVLGEVEAGKRTFVVPFSGLTPDSLVYQAASYAEIDAVSQRLFHAPTPKIHFGCVTIYANDRVCAVYPDVQLIAEAILDAIARQPPRAQGVCIQAHTPDRLRRVIIQQSYPAYYVYEVSHRPAPGFSWRLDDRIGNDQLVILLADAYRKGHWFAKPGQEGIVWNPQA
jgi:hypothetical protein